jgi:serine/threonine protein kinase
MSCPAPSALQEFIEAPPDAPHSEALKAHFAACDECRALVLAMTPARTDPLAATVGSGQRIGRYQVRHRLGEGGMGVVWAAHDPDLGRNVALKLMRRAAGDDERSDREVQARLLREAHAMARLNHPGVIIVYDVGTCPEGVFIAMELVEGETLARWLATPRPWREVLELCVRAGRGLEAAHAAGLVHRDFKPDNVLVGSDGRVRVTDFGLARMLGPLGLDSTEERAVVGVSPLTRTLTGRGMVLGTPAYMAPEQLDSAPTDARTDVFSFCVAVFEALYRRRPFIGANLQELRDAIGANRVAQLSDGEVPRRLRDVLERGLRAQPAERYRDMSALLAAIEEAARPPRRLRLRELAIAVGALMLLALAGVIGWREKRTPSPPPPVPPPSVPRPATGSAPARPAPGTLRVHVGRAARIVLDGELMASAATQAELAIDPAGEHTLEVTAPGFRPYRVRVRVAAGATVEHEVALERAGKRRGAASLSPKGDDDPDGTIDPYAP